MEFHPIDHATNAMPNIIVLLQNALIKSETLCNAGSIFRWPAPRQRQAKWKASVFDMFMPLSSVIDQRTSAVGGWEIMIDLDQAILNPLFTKERDRLGSYDATRL